MARLSDAVAPPGHAPLDFQTPHPTDLYQGRGVPVSDSADLQRILALPRRVPVDPASPEAEALVEYVTAKYARDRRGQPCACRSINRDEPCITRLLPIQAIMLHEMSLAGGMLGHIGAGAGKTAVGLLAPLAMADIRRAILLVPSTLLEQTRDDYRRIAEHFRVPELVVHFEKGRDETWASPGQPRLDVMSYNRLSLKDSSTWLDTTKPDAIIADEVDALSDMTSTRVIRMWRYFTANPRTRFCGWTGSLIDHKLAEVAHLADWALRDRSPFPRDPLALQEWGCALDASTWQSPPGELMQLCMPGEEVREGFRRRLADTRGFIITGENKVLLEGGEEVRSIIVERAPPTIPAIIEEALRKVRKFERPDTLAPDGLSPYDDELRDPLAQAKCAAEVATGIFYRFTYPNGETKEQIDPWFMWRKLYYKEVRTKVLAGEPYLDSPTLCEEAAKRFHGDLPPRHDRPSWPSRFWPKWRDIQDTVHPVTRAVRLSDYLVQDAAQWAHQNRGIVWYGMVELGQWLAEVSKLELHAGGQGAGARILASDGSRSIIASVKSHGRGRNGLQHKFSRQLLMNMLSSSRMVEQWLKRLHRKHQKAGEVVTEVYTHVPELRKSFRQAISRARFVKEVLGASQCLLDGWQGFEDDSDEE